jgi:hypothetical protein
MASFSKDSPTRIEEAWQLGYDEGKQYSRAVGETRGFQRGFSVAVLGILGGILGSIIVAVYLSSQPPAPAQTSTCQKSSLPIPQGYPNPTFQ